MTISFTVYGDPLPKGSTRAFMPKGARFPIITSATKGLKAWEQKIAGAAQIKASGILMVGALNLTVTFFLARPKYLGKKIGVPHIKRPDLDKLIRGATDALTGTVWKDDAQLVEIAATKCYVEAEAEAPRAEFTIVALEDR